MLIHFQRKSRTSQNYSIEQVFESIRKQLNRKIAVQVRVCPFESDGLLRRILNALDALLNQGTINHITGDVHYIGIPLKKNRTIHTFHDIGFLNIKPGVKRWILKKFWLEWPIANCGFVTTVSYTTRNAIMKEVHVPSEKIKVIYNPIFDGFRYTPKEFNVKKPRILHFGTAPNKNTSRLIYALTYLPCKLVLIGKQRPEILSQLERSGMDYIYTWNLSKEQIIEEYMLCDIVSMISTLEGFGLPIIEGQKTGRVIITSSLSSMPETAGEGACYVNPYSLESIREGFWKIVRDASYREYLIAQGSKNVERFEPHTIAEQYLELYSEILT